MSKVIEAHTLHFKPIFGFHWKKLLGQPSPLKGMGYQNLAVLWRVWKFRGAAPTSGRNMVFRKSRFLCTIAHRNLRNKWSKVHPTFSPNARGNAVFHLVFRVWISFFRSGDIRAQIEKGSKIGPHLACFSPPIFGGREAGPQIFGPALWNWSCFRAWCKISRRSAKGPRRFRVENTKAVVKHKALPNHRSGRPKTIAVNWVFIQ